MSRITLKNKTLTSFQYAVQGIGTVFVSLFVAAYLFSLPGTNILHGEPIVNYLLAIFGSVFLVLVLTSIILSFIVKTED